VAHFKVVSILAAALAKILDRQSVVLAEHPICRSPLTIHHLHRGQHIDLRPSCCAFFIIATLR